MLNTILPSRESSQLYTNNAGILTQCNDTNVRTLGGGVDRASCRSRISMVRQFNHVEVEPTRSRSEPTRASHLSYIRSNKTQMPFKAAFTLFPV